MILGQVAPPAVAGRVVLNDAALKFDVDEAVALMIGAGARRPAGPVLEGDALRTPSSECDAQSGDSS